MNTQRPTKRYWLSYHSLPHFLEAQSLTEPGLAPTINPLVHTPRELKLQITSRFLYGCWGFELRTSCLHGKCSYPLSHLSSPPFLLGGLTIYSRLASNSLSSCLSILGTMGVPLPGQSCAVLESRWSKFTAEISQPVLLNTINQIISTPLASLSPAAPPLCQLQGTGSHS